MRTDHVDTELHIYDDKRQLSRPTPDYAIAFYAAAAARNVWCRRSLTVYTLYLSASLRTCFSRINSALLVRMRFGCSSQRYGYIAAIHTQKTWRRASLVMKHRCEP